MSLLGFSFLFAGCFYPGGRFIVLESGALAASDWSTLRTSWAKRLKSGAKRMVFYIIAAAAE